MKKTFFYSFLIMLSLSLMSSTCSPDDDDINSNGNSAEINQIKTSVESNTWQITSFIDSGSNETNHFTGYSFTFNSNGTLTASNASNTVTGSWSITDSSKSDDEDDSSDDIDFNIFFTSPANFNDDLTEDWDIVSYSNTTISLIHISGGNGGTDTLVFEKN